MRPQQDGQDSEVTGAIAAEQSLIFGLRKTHPSISVQALQEFQVAGNIRTLPSQTDFTVTSHKSVTQP